MPGLALINSRCPINPKQRLLFPFHKIVTTVEESIVGSTFQVARSTNAKFLDDKIFEEDSDILIAIQGVILNLTELKARTGTTNTFDTLKQLYQTDGPAFFKCLRGEFSGILFDRQLDEWIVFTDHLGSNPVYFFNHDGLFICAWELKVVSSLLRQLDKDVELNPVGARMLLDYGFLFGDDTILSDVKKLRPGHYLRVRHGDCEEHAFFSLKNTPYHEHSRSDIFCRLDELFAQAVQREYSKDREYGYPHIATLSGGLDSRMTVKVAEDLGYHHERCFTMGQKGCLDETIAAKIASDLCINHTFFDVGHGEYFSNLSDHSIQITEGTYTVQHATHGLFLLDQVSQTGIECGLWHTGQLGDAVLGSFLAVPQHIPAEMSSTEYVTRASKGTNEDLKTINSQYENAELAKWYGRAFNGVSIGSHVASHFTYLASPFMDLDFIQYALRLAPSHRYKQRIYKEWIINNHPSMAQYPWAKNGLSIRAPDWLISVRRYLLAVTRILFGIKKKSMLDIPKWAKSNKEFRRYLEISSDVVVPTIRSHAELNAQCCRMLSEGDISQKLAVLSLVQGAAIHFN